jgi:hypothetical protein
MKKAELKVGKSPYMKLSEMIPNEKNPRTLTEEDYQLLINSIKQSPSFMELKPIILDKFGVIQGGNQRYKAYKELGFEKAPFDVYTEDRFQKDIEARKKLAKEKGEKFVLPTYLKLCREFVIKDNLHNGKFDNELLIDEFEIEELESFGLPIFVPEEIDYSALDEEDEIENEIDSMYEGVKKAIQIEFNIEHYEEAFELVKYFRSKEAYVGGMIIELLKTEKEKAEK